MTSPLSKEKGPASVAADPDRGSTNPAKDQNMETDTRSTTRAIAVVEAWKVESVTSNLEDALGDIGAVLRLCGKLVVDVAEDVGIKDSTAAHLHQVSSTLLVLSRAIDWELHEVERLRMMSVHAIKEAAA